MDSKAFKNARSGPLLVGGASGHQDAAVLVLHDLGGEGRRDPVLGLDGLDVVHEVDQESLRGSGVVVAPDAGVSGGGDDFRFLESQALQVRADHLRHLRDALVLSAHRELAEPAADLLEVVVEVGIDVTIDGIMTPLVGGDRFRVELLGGRDVQPGARVLPGGECRGEQ
jgi:hypothetical protein